MKNLRNVARKYGSRIVTAAALSAPALSFAEGSGNAVLDGVDFSTVATWVGGVGLVIVGITMAYKGISLAKRAIAKV